MTSPHRGALWPQRALPFSSGPVCSERSTTLPAFGDANFERIRRNNKFYVDKTQFAAKLVDIERAVLLRPPRSGKTLFVDTLECLYDVHFKDRFDDLFGGLHVGENKPQQANQFYVLKIPLTAVPVSLSLTDYKNKFHECVFSGISSFFRRHPHVLAQIQALPSKLVETVLGNPFNTLHEICNIVGADKLMVLVDEYDRAPMKLYSELAPTLDRHNIAAALNPVTDPLSGLLATLKSLGARYYVTGIFTVPGLALSIFNDNEDLTHQPSFAQAFGMSADDVRRGLHLVCDVDGDEAERAVEFLRKAANGYNFFGCTETVFNPQLVHRFLNDYTKKGYGQELPTEVYDHNQVFSTHGLQIAQHDAELSRMLVKACASGEAFTGRVATTTTSLSATTYLFQLGVLTLDRQGVEYRANKEVRLVVPNASVRLNYAQAFLEYHTGQFGSASAFLHDPTVTSLENLLKTLMRRQHWGSDQTEADLQALLTAEFIVSSQGEAGAERHHIDCRVVVPDQRVIVLELKTVSGTTAGKAASQALGKRVAKPLDLHTNELGGKYSEEALTELAQMWNADFLTLNTTYSHKGEKFKTVGDVHQLAEAQATRYMAEEAERQAETTKLPVLGFAVTQVANRCHVTQVGGRGED